MASPSSVSASTSSVSVQEVPIFWDLNTCPLGASPKDLVRNIEKTLGQLHDQDPDKYPKYILSTTKIACGNLMTLGEANENCLVAEGFKLFHCVERDSYCGSHPKPKPRTPAAELRLKTCLINYIIRHGSEMPKNILLVSGDFDFHYQLDTLWKKGYTIFLAIREDSIIDFQFHGNYTWFWEQMERGRGQLIQFNDAKYSPPT